MAPHSSTLAWKIPWTEEPGRLQSMGSRRVGHHWATSLSLFSFMHQRRKWQPTPVFLPGESQGRGSLVGCCLRGCTESDTTEVTQQQQQQHRSSLSLNQLTFTYLFKVKYVFSFSFPGGASGKESICQSRRCKRHGFDPWFGKISWRRTWQPTLVFFPGESHGFWDPWQEPGSLWVHRVIKSWTQLKQLSMHTCTQIACR